jgi:hypothetical protein
LIPIKAAPDHCAHNHKIPKVHVRHRATQRGEQFRV